MLDKNPIKKRNHAEWNIIKDYISEIENKLNVTMDFFVFGSLARGEYKAGKSDIDIVMVAKERNLTIKEQMWCWRHGENYGTVFKKGRNVGLFDPLIMFSDEMQNNVRKQIHAYKNIYHSHVVSKEVIKMCECVSREFDSYFSDPHNASIDLNRDEWEKVKNELQADRAEFPQELEDLRNRCYICNERMMLACGTPSVVVGGCCVGADWGKTKYIFSRKAHLHCVDWLIHSSQKKLQVVPTNEDGAPKLWLNEEEVKGLVSVTKQKGGGKIENE